MPRRSAYAVAGVDLATVQEIHSQLWRRFEKTFETTKAEIGRPVGRLGHYAGLLDIGRGKLLALHVDGVGTKVLVAQLMNRFDTIGVDCVAMCVNDIISVGSEPVALVDYLALQKADAELVSEVAKGLAKGAQEAGVAIVGGETAVMGDVVKGVDGKGFDLAAMAVGVVDRRRVVDGSGIDIGDAIIGVASSGIHSNGLTLARKILLTKHNIRHHVPELGRSVGAELLEPTAIYVRPVLEALDRCEIHGLAHITGGAFSKLTRLVGSRRLMLRLHRMPKPPAIFELIRRKGRISVEEMYRVFNMGVGFCVFAPPAEVENIISIFAKYGHRAAEIGNVSEGVGISLRGAKLQ